MHDGNLPRGAAEADEAELQPGEESRAQADGGGGGAIPRVAGRYGPSRMLDRLPQSLRLRLFSVKE